MVRFLHSADWQLGMTRRFLDAEAQPRFTAARTEVVAAIGALAVAEGCAFVVVCGDVFETNHVDRQVVGRALDAMAATPEVTFYLLPGNHDPLDPSSVFRSPTFVGRQPPNVVVLDGTARHPVAPGVELVAAPWTTKRPVEDLVSAVLADLPADGTVRIVAGHGAVSTLSPDRDDPSVIQVERVEAALSAGRAHYVALGDRHSTTAVGTTGRIHYSGAPEPTAFVEEDPGNVLLVELAAGAVSVVPHRVGTWTFASHYAHLTGEVGIAALEQFLDGLPDKGRTIVQLTLEGQVTLTHKARLDQVLAHQGDLFAALLTWDKKSDLVVLPDDGDLAALELSGFAQDAAADLREQAAAPRHPAVAQDALGLLFRLASTSA